MDTKEFKAWFEGFCDGIDNVPTPEQWAKIKSKIQSLAGEKIDYSKLFPRERTGSPRWAIDANEQFARDAKAGLTMAPR